MHCGACPHPTCYSILMQFDVGHGTLPTFLSICIVQVVKNASRRKTKERERGREKKNRVKYGQKRQNQLPTVGQVAQGFAR